MKSFIFLAILLLSIFADEAVDGGLKQYFPFRGNSNNVVNPSLSGTPYKAKLDVDKYGNSDKALKFEYGDIGRIVLPNEVLAGLSDFTLTLWIKPDYNHLTKKGEHFMISVFNNGYDNFFLFSPYALAFKNKFLYYFSNSDSDINLKNGNWYHFALTRSVSRNEFQIFIDGVLKKSITAQSSTLGAQSIVFGADLDRLGGGFDKDDCFIGSFQDFRVYDRVKSAEEIVKIRDFVYCSESEYKDLSTPQKCHECKAPCKSCKSEVYCLSCIEPTDNTCTLCENFPNHQKQGNLCLTYDEYSTCYNHLQTLDTRKIRNQSISNTCEDFEKDNKIAFAINIQFLNKYFPNFNCEDFKFLFNERVLQEGTQFWNNWYYSVKENNIKLNVSLEDIDVLYKCELLSSNKTYLWVCPIEMIVGFGGISQLEYNFGLQIEIQRDSSKVLSANVEPNLVIGDCCKVNPLDIFTDLRFCEDITCTKYLEGKEIKVKRGQEFYIEHFITTEKFKFFYLEGLQLNFGILKITPIETDGSQPGRFIWRAKSSVANPQIVITSISRISKEKPDNKRRNLQENDELGDNYYLQGQQVIEVIDEDADDDKKESESNSNSIELIAITAAVCIGIGSAIGGVACYCNKKKSGRKQKYEEKKQNQAETEKDLNDDEEK